ncbi:MAG: DUF2203 domain-containing protein [Candidatus Limnocylindrales bacterium]|nr:DUF2203 domain-containing protein [Chloroflexota bacterium]
MTRYYAIDAANRQLAELRPLLERLRADRDEVARLQDELTAFRQADGSADHARDLADREAAIRTVVQRMKRTVTQLDDWSVALRDISSGLVDFPALVNGRPIWLCWRLGEDGIGWWHELETGVAGRKSLIELA